MLTRKGAYLAQMYPRQWWSPDRLAAHQAERLADMLAHAYATVPYYRRRFDDAGVGQPPSRGTLEEIGVPVTRKPDLAPLPIEDRLSSRANRSEIITLRSSGSTGEPFEIPSTMSLTDQRGAAIIRMQLANGIYPPRRIAVLAPQLGIVPKPMHGISLYRRVFGPINGSLDEQVAFLRDVEANVIEGYPSYLGNLAHHLVDQGITDIRPQTICTNSETLSENTREVIRTAFGTDPVNLYDCWEVGLIAWQCPVRNGLHMNVDQMVVEVLVDGKPAQPGETGEIVVTGLNNRAAPLIRYSMNDLAEVSAETCSCGRGLPLLTRVGGRTNVNFIHADGRKVAGTSIISLAMMDFPSVSIYQAVQRVPGELEMHVVASEPLGQDVLDRIATALREFLHIDAVTVTQTPAVNRGAAGKVHTFVNDIPLAAVPHA